MPEEADLKEGGGSPLERTVKRETTPFSPVGPEESHALPEPAEVTQARARSDQHVNQYVLVHQLGKGGMGTVWKAWDTKLWRMVAIKFLTDVDADGVRRFRREAQVAAQLRHPNITTVYEINECGGKPFIAMEFIDGTSIDKAQLPFDEMLRAFVQVCRAVDAGHQAGVVHRDLKPANILFGKDGKPYVTDFGLAKMVRMESSLSRSGLVVGTPSFMAPEQACGDLKQVDAQSDVYGLGATLYHLCVGQPPFVEEDPTAILLRVLSVDPPRPRKLKPDLPAAVEAVILQAIQKEKKRRYATAAALADDLERYLNQQTVLARPPSTLNRAWRRLRRNPGWAVAGLFLLPLVGLGITLAVRRTSRPPRPSAVEPEKERERSEPDRFPSVQGDLAYYRFRPGAAVPVREAKEFLAGLPAGRREEVARWFQAQLAQAPPSEWPKTEWDSRRDEARKIVEWSAMMEDVLSSAIGPEFAPVRGEFGLLRERFLPVTRYRGSFSLKLYTFPPSEVRELKVGDVWVVRKEDAPVPTPAVFGPLDIGDLSVTLRGSTEKTVEVAAKELENGKTYLISGRFERPETIRLRAP